MSLFHFYRMYDYRAQMWFNTFHWKLLATFYSLIGLLEIRINKLISIYQCYKNVQDLNRSQEAILCNFPKNFIAIILMQPWHEA